MLEAKLLKQLQATSVELALNNLEIMTCKCLYPCDCVTAAACVKQKDSTPAIDNKLVNADVPRPE